MRDWTEEKYILLSTRDLPSQRDRAIPSHQYGNHIRNKDGTITTVKDYIKEFKAMVNWYIHKLSNWFVNKLSL